MFNKYKKSKLPKYDEGAKVPMTNDQYNMSLYSPADQAALQGNTTDNVYNDKRSFGNNIGQYAGYAQAAGQTAGNLGYINSQGYDEQTKATYQGQAVGNGLTQSGAAFSPLIGMGTGIRKSATSIVGDKSGANRTASNWMAAPHEAASSDFAAAKTAETDAQKFGSYGAAMGDFNPAGTKLRQMFSYGTGNDEKTTGFWGKYNDLTGITGRNNQKALMNEQQFAMGGMNGMPNSEVEKQENTLNPDGSATQFNGPSHEQGGIPTQLDPGTLIFSDKLKYQGKTFATLNKANNTSKEDKILSDKKASSTAKQSAELSKQAKIKNSLSIFKIQEDLKQTKFDNYQKRLGGIQKFPWGGKKPGENQINDLTGREQGEYQNWFNQASKYATDNGEAFNADDYTLDSYRKIFNPISQDGANGNSTFPTQTPGINPQGQSGWFNRNKDSLYTAGHTLAQSAGQLSYLGEQGKKYDTQQFYNYNPSLLDSSAAMRDATEQTRRAERSVRDASGGNAANYLSNRVALNTQNILNKDRIRQQYANANAGISNQAAQYNIGNKYMTDDINAKNKGAALTNYYNTLGSVGTNVAQGMKDNRQMKTDEDTIGMFTKLYNNPEFQKFMKERKK